MIPHPATKQQVMREGEEKARGGGEGAKSQPCEELFLCFPLQTTGAMKALPTYTLKNVQGQTLFYPAPAFI